MTDRKSKPPAADPAKAARPSGHLRPPNPTDKTDRTDRTMSEQNSLKREHEEFAKAIEPHKAAQVKADQGKQTAAAAQLAMSFGLPDPVAVGATLEERLSDWRSKSAEREMARQRFEGALEASRASGQQWLDLRSFTRPSLWQRGFTNQEIDSAIEARLQALQALNIADARWLGTRRLHDLDESQWLPKPNQADGPSEAIKDAFDRWAFKSVAVRESDAIWRNAHEPKDLDELCKMLRDEADAVYAKHGLPVGKVMHAYREDGGQIQWLDDPEKEPAGSYGIKAASLLIAHADNKTDEALVLASQLHSAIQSLEGASRAEPPSVFRVTVAAMDVQVALAELRAVTKRRADSEATLAQTTRSGVQAKQGQKNLTKAANEGKAKKAKKPEFLEAARTLLSNPRNRQMSMGMCIRALAELGHNKDEKTARTWLKESGLFVQRGAGPSYLPNPTLFESSKGGRSGG